MTRTPLALLLLALGLTGCSPQPIDLSRDCPKKPNCTECAAQIGCAWCGTECIRMGHKECPPGIIRHPDDCRSAAAPAPAAPQ